MNGIKRLNARFFHVTFRGSLNRIALVMIILLFRLKSQLDTQLYFYARCKDFFSHDTIKVEKQNSTVIGKLRCVCCILSLVASQASCDFTHKKCVS